MNELQPIERKIRKGLIWLPSLIISVFFIQNALKKVFLIDQQHKIITDSTFLIFVGVILLIATALFLFNKTLLFGTAIWAFYMSCIVLIHLYKGKPFEVAILIVMATIFAAFLRRSELLNWESNSE